MNLPWEFVPFDTERLHIRPMHSSDLDDIMRFQREDVTIYLTHGPRTREDSAARLERNAAAVRLEKDDDWIQPAIEVDGRMVGWLYLKLASVEHRGAEIGWTVHPDVQGRGYATEGATALLDLAFGVIGLHRVRAELDPRNAASIGVCRRLGMREEAHHVRDFHDERIPGGWGDTGIYAILEDEWTPRTGIRAAP